VRRAVELPNIHHIILVFEYSGLVIVHIQIIGSAKNRYQRRKAGCLTFPIHSIPDGTRKREKKEKAMINTPAKNEHQLLIPSREKERKK